MYAEFKFLFDPSWGSKVIDNENNTIDIYGNYRNKNKVLYFKSKDDGPINTIRERIYEREKTDGDPYIELIRNFSYEVCKTKSLQLKAADFAYLRDLGVYPINRLVILRRFPDGIIVPANLLEWGESAVPPISTVVGWAKAGNDSLFNISFNEVWTTQTETLDKMFAKIMKDEFGQDITKWIPSPGWTQGFLWGFLNKSGLSSETYNAYNVPQGDPNVLKESKMRDITQQGLRSDFTFKLETIYEQKFISGVDPSAAMLDILANLTRMGTSDMHYYLKPNSGAMQKLIAAVNSSEMNNESLVKTWVDFISSLVSAFIEGMVQSVVDTVNTFKDAVETANNEAGLTTGKAPKITNVPTEEMAKLSTSAGNLLKNVATTLLAGTVMKYRWPIRGSLALMTGLPTTPWHLTIGNPYAPVISLNNIVVDNVDIALGSEFGFGDIPVNVTATINMSLGRSLGRQEIDYAFNNSYKRVYGKPTSEDVAKAQEKKTESVTDNKGKPEIEKKTEEKKKEITKSIPINTPTRTPVKTGGLTKEDYFSNNTVKPTEDTFVQKPGIGFGRIK